MQRYQMLLEAIPRNISALKISRYTVCAAQNCWHSCILTDNYYHYQLMFSIICSGVSGRRVLRSRDIITNTNSTGKTNL